jgi:L-arabinose transport system ATP-binding protein
MTIESLTERATGLAIDGVSKAFPNVRALLDVSLRADAGEILAVMGENGAGKSTLLRIIAGDYRPDTGALSLDGRPLAMSSPREARAAGIRVVSQEPEIVPGVDVAENIYLGELPTARGVVTRARIRERVRADLARFGFADVLPLDLMGDELSPAQRQLVEIMRALKPGLRVLALDEPTSSLTDEESARVFELLRNLRSQGVAIIYVSHRINEILRLADRVAVLRDGRLIALREAAGLTAGEIVRLMVGRALTDLFKGRHVPTERVVLRVEDLHSAWHRGVSFEIHAGEIVGLAGLMGAGRTELAKTMVGALPMDRGQVWIDGSPVSLRSPGEAMNAGIGMTPEDRKQDGLLLGRSVIENTSLAILGRLSKLGFVRADRERELVRSYVERLSVRTPSLQREVGRLSGGNQQKIVLARWLAAGPRILILDEPTRGIDVGAKAEIYRLIDELAGEGLGILFISSELPEILGMSDRILVMQNGRITGEVQAKTATEQQILELAMVDHIAVPGQMTTSMAPGSEA